MPIGTQPCFWPRHSAATSLNGGWNCEPHSLLPAFGFRRLLVPGTCRVSPSPALTGAGDQPLTPVIEAHDVDRVVKGVQVSSSPAVAIRSSMPMIPPAP